MTNRKLRRKCWRIILAVVAFIVTIVLVLLLFYFQCGQESECRSKLIAERYWLFVVVAAIWTIGPPLWFLLEYAFLYNKKDPETTFEEFRYQQQLAAALWLGVMACLAAVWTVIFA